MNEKRDYIRSRVSINEMLAGLAEECGELIQASLKLRRVFSDENPTPIKEDDAIENLHEEIADVILYLRMLDVNRKYIDEIITYKTDRWAMRLGLNAEEEDEG